MKKCEVNLKMIMTETLEENNGKNTFFINCK